MKFKIAMYILSLWLLFPMVIIKDFRWYWDGCVPFWSDIQNLAANNLISVFCLLMLFLGVLIYVWFSHLLKGATGIKYTIIGIENQNHEFLAFLMTYIIPFVSVSREDPKSLMVSSFLLLVIGAIFVKTNLFYTNPSLALLGYKIRKITTLETNKNDQRKKEAIYITKATLSESEMITRLIISDNVYFAKK